MTAAGTERGQGFPRVRPAARSESVDASRQEPGWCEIPTSTQLAVTRPNVNDARCEALFASGLQPSDTPTAGMVAEAITGTVRRFGTGVHGA